MKNNTDSVEPTGWLAKIRSNLKNMLRNRSAPDTKEELESEIQELLEEGEEQGLISSQEEKMISSIFEFRDTIASEIMTPAVEMVKADISSSTDELIALVVEEGHTRIPVYEETVDKIVGIIHAKDLLPYCLQDKSSDYDFRKYIYQPVFVAEDAPISELLRLFQRKKSHMAIVMDEFGSVRGLVTLEDVIEEIVGEIDDEHDQNDQEIKKMGDTTILVDAKLDLEKVEDFFAVEFEDGPYESVGGVVLHCLGKVPSVGDVAEMNDLRFTVRSADARRIKKVQIDKVMAS